MKTTCFEIRRCKTDKFHVSHKFPKLEEEEEEEEAFCIQMNLQLNHVDLSRRIENKNQWTNEREHNAPTANTQENARIFCLYI